jgi:uncharacterized integral membrane protein
MPPMYQDLQRRTTGRLRTVLALVGGSFLGIFMILFAVANDDWIVVSLPNSPWHSQPSQPAFEARLWAVMLASFLLGSAVTGAGVYLVRRVLALRTAGQKKRIDELERELEKTNRLLAATRKTM